MADADTGPFGEHKSRPEEPTDDLNPGEGPSILDPESEEETSFGGRISS